MAFPGHTHFSIDERIHQKSVKELTESANVALLFWTLFYLCFMFVFVMLACLFLTVLWSPAGKGLTSLLSNVSCVLVFLSFTHMVF